MRESVQHRPQPLVTIVIPAYNAAGTVADSVRSALTQTHARTEVIVVDDGSADGTADIAAHVSDRVAVVRVSHGGLRKARDVGHQEAHGELIAWLDADDLAAPHRIEVQVEVLRRLRDVVVVSSDFTSFDADGPLADTVRSYYGRLAADGALEGIYREQCTVDTLSGSWRVRSGNVSGELPFGNFVHPPTIMIRRTALEGLHSFDVDLPISDDWLRLALLSEVGDFAFVDAPLLSYRHSRGQLSAPSNRVRAGIDSLRATEIILAHRIDLSREQPARIRRVLAARNLTAAEALADESGARALRYLKRSLGFARPTVDHALVAVKAVLPRPVLAAYRKVRRTRGAYRRPA